MRVLRSFLLFFSLFLFIGLAKAFTLSGTGYGGSSPLPDASVALNDANTGAYLGVSTTDTSGVYSFDTPTDGIYTITVTSPSGSGFGESVVNGIVISGADEAYHVVLVVRAYNLSGTIHGPDGLPLPASGVNVSIYDHVSGARIGNNIKMSAEGEYIFSVAEGLYKIS